MDKLNKKEKECIINYTDDLVSIMHEEKSVEFVTVKTLIQKTKFVQ